MHIVSFGDIHMATHRMTAIEAELRAADLIVLSGDLTNFGGVADARSVIRAAQAFGPPVLALPGNVDRPEVIPFLHAEGVSLHRASHRYGEIVVYGCGGSNLTPFHTPLEYTDGELWHHLGEAVRDVPPHACEILVCHTPPYATATDRLRDGRPVGSPAVRQFIRERQPALCITGHIHESPGVGVIGRTPVVNAGAFAAGGYVVARCKNGAVHAELRRVQATPRLPSEFRVWPR